MAIPLWVLAAATVAAGIRIGTGSPEAHHVPGWLTGLSLALAASGIGLALATYQFGVVGPAALSRAFGPLDRLARQGYGIDAAFTGLYRVALLGLSRGIGWIDRYLVDGVLNAVSVTTLGAGDRLRRIQSGQVQDYVYGVAFGLIALIVASRLLR
jgi:NADH-quinone oxidoreductase subunit L